LKSFFETVAAALRQAAPGKLLVFEPSGTTPGQGGVIAVPPDGSDWIFGPHYYEPEAFVFGPDVTTAWTNMTSLLTPFQQLGPKWNLPVFLGEFGVSNQYMNTANYLAASWNALDALAMSGTVWHFSTTPDFMAQEQFDLWLNGQETPGFDASVRPQPSVIAGTLESFSFDRTSGHATITLDALPNGVTELVVPTRRYPKGPSVSADGAHIEYEYDASSQRLRLKVPKGGTTTVTLTP
jgi:YD repeat-containing protein